MKIKFKKSDLYYLMAVLALIIYKHVLPSDHSGKDVTKVNNHAYVDLGLPSGTKWATANVGAKKNTDGGYNFAWGEVRDKALYDMSNYIWRDIYVFSQETCIKYNKDDNKTKLEARDDAASVRWGTEWRMPTKEEFEELIDNCDWEIQYNKNNYIFLVGRSKTNGEAITFPACGFMSGYDTSLYGQYGGYWSSTLFQEHTSDAYIFSFNSKSISCVNNNRCEGLKIRPVLR